jgi:hypothetical protein
MRAFDVAYLPFVFLCRGIQRERRPPAGSGFAFSRVVLTSLYAAADPERKIGILA